MKASPPVEGADEALQDHARDPGRDPPRRSRLADRRGDRALADLVDLDRRALCAPSVRRDALKG
jgi:hypothetical protein